MSALLGILFAALITAVSLARPVAFIYVCEADGQIVKPSNIVPSPGCPMHGMHAEGTNEWGEWIGGCVHRMRRSKWIEP